MYVVTIKDHCILKYNSFHVPKLLLEFNFLRVWIKQCIRVFISHVVLLLRNFVLLKPIESQERYYVNTDLRIYLHNLIKKLRS